MAAKIQSVILILIVVAAMAAGKATASYSQCFRDCKKDCDTFAFICTIRCALDCSVPSPPSKAALAFDRRPTTTDSLYYCKLGCASTLCANLISNQNSIAEEKVEGCVGSCSAACTKNYLE